MNLSIKQKLTLFNVLVIVFLFALFTAVVYFSLGQSLKTTAKQKVLESSQIIANKIRTGTPPSSSSLIKAAPPGVFLIIRNKNFKIIQSTIKIEHGQEGTNYLKKAITSKKAITAYADISSQAPDFITVQAVSVGKSTYIIETGIPVSDIYESLANLRSVLLIAGIVSVLLTLIGAYILAWISIRPIDTITKITNEITSKHLNKRVPIDNPNDEIGKLTVNLNNLLERLESSFLRQQQFVSNAAHELSTPLSAIRGYLGILKSWGKHKPDVREEAIRRIDLESKRMVNLTEELLTLAISDEKIISPEKTDLGKLLNEAVLLKQKEVKNKNLVFLADKQIFAFVDPQKLQQLILILLDNAAKYTPVKGQVKVKLHENNKWTIIEVADNGIGIAKEDLPYVFDRFYRADKVRTKNSGGSGLGLSIAKSIVDAHNGKLLIKSFPGKGTTIHCMLPKLLS